MPKKSHKKRGVLRPLKSNTKLSEGPGCTNLGSVTVVSTVNHHQRRRVHHRHSVLGSSNATIDLTRQNSVRFTSISDDEGRTSLDTVRDGTSVTGIADVSISGGSSVVRTSERRVIPQRSHRDLQGQHQGQQKKVQRFSSGSGDYRFDH